MRRGLLALGFALACGGQPQGETRPAAQPEGPAQTTEPAAAVPASRGGAELVGTAARGWDQLTWLNSPPLSIEGLRGKVVLVRFWTDTCPFCAASAPSIQKVHADYADEGLVVIGMYHPKPRGTVRELAAIESRAEQLGIEFPIAVDEQWKTLDDWWLGGTDERRATSVSFLIDRRGTIRYVHPGPVFHEGEQTHPGDEDGHGQCHEDYAAVRAGVEALLAERDAS